MKKIWNQTKKWLKKHEAEIIACIISFIIVVVGILVFEEAGNRIDGPYNTTMANSGSEPYGPYGPYGSNSSNVSTVDIVGPTSLLPPLVCLLIAGAVIYFVGVWRFGIWNPFSRRGDS